MALLAKASMSLKFWDEVFLTPTYLINLLQSKVLNFKTSAKLLLREIPDYALLKVFGCAYWPNLRPFNPRKLAFRSKRCAFLGYSSRHKCYKCLDISSGRVFILRYVVFDKDVFPFEALHENARGRLRQEILLLPDHLCNISQGEANSNDSIYTNAHDHDNAFGTVGDMQDDFEENSVQNTGLNQLNRVFLPFSEGDSGTESDEDLLTGSGGNPGGDSLGAPPGHSAASTGSASTRLLPRDVSHPGATTAPPRGVSRMVETKDINHGLRDHTPLAPDPLRQRSVSVNLLPPYRNDLKLGPKVEFQSQSLSLMAQLDTQAIILQENLMI